MNPDLTTIKAAIEASRERIYAEQMFIAQQISNYQKSKDELADTALTASQKTPEYKLTEALAVAVEALGSYGHADPSIISMANDAIAKIAAIVKEATP